MSETNLINRIKLFSNKEIRINSSSGLTLSFFVPLLLLLVFSFFEYIFNFSSQFRTLLFFIILISFFIFFILYFLHPLFKLKFLSAFDRYLIVSEKIGNHFPEIKDKLLNVIQLSIVENNKVLYSQSLIDAALNNVDKLTSNIDFSEAISKKRISRNIIYLSSTLLVLLLFSIFNSGFSSALNRIVNYSKDFTPPQRFYFEISPGDTTITKGDNLIISAKINGQKLSKVYVNIASEESEYFESKEISPDSQNIFSYNIISPSKSFKYFFSAEEIKSNLFKVEVINRPIIRNLKITISPPSYTKIPGIEQEDNGDIKTIYGSNISLSITSSKTLSKAFIFFNDSTSLKMNVSGNKANVNFVIKKNCLYKIIINDEYNNTNINPMEYAVSVINDENPEINLLKPPDDLALTENLSVPTMVRIKDDFGFSKLILNYRLSFSKYEAPQEKFESISISIPNEKETIINYLWNVSNLNLVTEDVVSYYFEVFDNDQISGPKSARTNVQKIRIPSLNEIIAESELEQKNNLTDLENTLKETEELKKEINELDKDLKSGKDKLNWNEQNKSENLLKKQEKIQEKLDNIQKSLNDVKNNLNENKLLSSETLEKYMELQKLFSELNNEEMKSAMKKLDDAIKNLNKQALQEALKNFQFNEEALKQNIERTISLLKHVQIEQKIDEIIKKIESLNKEQEEIENKINGANPEDKNLLEKLSQKQKDISKELNKLKNDLSDLQNRMSEFPKEMPLKDLNEMKEDLEKNNLDEKSDEASQEMMNGDFQKASQNQSKIKQSLNKLKNNLAKMKSQMMQNQMNTAINALKRIVNDLIEISKDQEDLKNSTQSMENNSSKLPLTRKQQFELLEDLNKVIKQLAELSNQSFAVTPEMAASIGKALSQMNQSLNNLENNNAYGSSQNQTQSMGALNEAATQMNNMIQEMMQSGQGGGMSSFMQRLQQLSAQQLSLNQITKQLMSGGQLSLQQQAQLQRLAAQQQAIQKSLDDLNKEIKESSKASKMLGDLGDAVKKMEEVIREMRQNKFDNDLINKQEKILTRMLDAQKSLYERDFEKKRESKTGDDKLKGKTPSDIISSDKKNKIQIDLLKSLQEGYSKDYEYLIKKYFEALQKLNN